MNIIENHKILLIWIAYIYLGQHQTETNLSVLFEVPINI